MPLAKRVYSLAEEQNDSTLMIAACSAVGATHYFLGNFEMARQYITRALQIWRSGGVRFSFQDVDAQSVSCLAHEALLQWHFGEIPSCRATIAEAISLAKELNDMHGLALALCHAARLAYYELSAAETERLASDLIELSTRYGFALWLAIGKIFCGWTRSVAGDTAEGLSWIKDGMDEFQATGSISWMSYFLALKAEALHRADRASEALQVITEAEAFVERTGGRYISAELHRLRGVFLVAVGADYTRIEASFRAAISIAKEQKSISLEKRAEATYAEYCRQKASQSA